MSYYAESSNVTSHHHLMKDKNPSHVAAVVSCQDREIYFPRWVINAEISLLTSREREVLLAIGECWSNRQIASRMMITERTVKKHVNSIFEKLEVPSRSHATLITVYWRAELKSEPT